MVDLEEAPYRAGIVPLVARNGQCHFGYGIDADYGTLIDLAGHIEPQDRSYADAAYREFTEETLGTFDTIITRQHLARAPAVHDRDTVTYLVRLDDDIDLPRLHQRFYQRLSQEAKPEVVDLRWLTYDELSRLTPNQMYRRALALVPKFPAALGWV